MSIRFLAKYKFFNYKETIMHIFKKVIYILLLYNTFWFEIINSMEDGSDTTETANAESDESDMGGAKPHESKPIDYISDNDSFDIDSQDPNNLPDGALDHCLAELEHCIDEYVYFNGEGESGQFGPVFDYENQNIKNSFFYGQKNVKTAVEFLKNINNQKTINSFHLDGMSMGAGILLKTLEQLCFAADNTSHYIDDIVTKEEAIDLIAKINAGLIILSVPIFSVQHTQLMVFASRSFSLITISLLYSLLKNTLIKEMSYKKHCIIFIGLVFLLQNMLSSKWSDMFDKKIIPRFISENYNPNDFSPLQAAKNIRKHVTCPILIHISENDELLYYTKREIQDFFSALSTSNQPTSNTILLLSKDGTHDHNNNDFKTIKNEFLCDPINYLPTKCIDEGNTKKSIIYDSTLDKPIHISYKDPVFPLISSGINCIKAYVFNKVIKKKEISHAYI